MTTQQVLGVTELCGDGIGPELEESIATIADALPIDFSFEKIDWSLATREEKGLIAIDEAESSMRRTGVGLKYPTVTGTQSPNALLRRRIDFSVIYRPCISIPGISSNFKENVDSHIVRVATGGTYDDPASSSASMRRFRCAWWSANPACMQRTSPFAWQRRRG